MTIPRWISLSFLALAGFMMWMALCTRLNGGAAGAYIFAGVIALDIIAALLFWNLEG